jgi:octaprenyl-diphosphate synthase
MSVVDQSIALILVLPQIDIKSILQPIAKDMAQLDQVIKQSLASDVALINEISHYLIQAGGKRIRPALTFLISGAIKDPSLSHAST